MTTTYNRKYYEENKDKVISRAKQWAIDNPDKIKQSQSQYRKSDKYLLNRRMSSYKRQYGITLEEYEQILKKQNHVCAICGQEETRTSTRETNGKKHLVVDHNHTTNDVRGLLCTKCNGLLGFSLDDISILEKAIIYLRTYG